MKVSLHVNGSLVIRLEPESDIERHIAAEMVAAAAKGRLIRLSAATDDALEVAVEQ